MLKNKKEQRPNPSIRERMLKKICRFFDWIAKGQTAGVLCKG